MNDRSNDLTSAYIAAVALPIVGFIWAIVLLTRNHVGPGLGVMAASVLAFSVYSVALAGL